MDSNLTQNLKKLYLVSEEAERLTFSERSSQGSYTDALKKEFCAFIGYVMNNTEFSENDAIGLTRDFFNGKITFEKLNKLSEADLFRKNVKNGQTEMMRIFINIDNNLYRADSTYNISLAQNLYIIYIQRGDMELDGYAFMLDGNGRVLSDNDLIFFGNEVSEDKSVRSDTFSGYPAIYIVLSRANPRYSKIDICFSAYGDNDNLNFRQVQSPIIQIINKGKELFHLCLNNLSKERCLVGIEFYLNKNVWKIKAVGAGYNGKLKALCESFGVEIE